MRAAFAAVAVAQRLLVSTASVDRTSTEAEVVLYASKPNPNLDRLKFQSPFPVTVLQFDTDEWRGTIDKLFAYTEYASQPMHPPEKLLIIVDAYDVFFSPEDTMARIFEAYRYYGKEILFSTEENAYPPPIAERAENYAEEVLGAKRTSSRFLNAGAVIGTAGALKHLYNQAMAPIAESPEGLRGVQQYADAVGHWFLHSLDQFLIWEFLFRKRDWAREFVAFDVEQRLFGSPAFRVANWPDILKSSSRFKFGVESENGFVNVDIPDEMIFDADLDKFHFDGCKFRFIGRELYPVLWHGHGPEKTAWARTLLELENRKCVPMMDDRPNLEALLRQSDKSKVKEALELLKQHADTPVKREAVDIAVQAYLG